MAKRTGSQGGLGAVGVGAVIVAGVIAAAGALYAAQVKDNLAATSVSPPDARGKMRLRIKNSSKAKFKIVAGHLQGGRTYDVIVGGVKVGAINTSAGGNGRATFSARPGSGDALLGFDPRGAQVVVRDAEDGDDVLVGDLPDDDPAAVACCLPESDDDGEVECEDLTADECTTQGGAPQAVASCLPNPCATTPPADEELVCCTNATGDDESPSECEDVSTEAECSTLGGTIVQATSCDVNPCAGTPPTNRTACCVPDDDGSGEIDCEVLSAEACKAEGGTSVGVGAGTTAATCSNDPCGTGSGTM